MTQTPVKKFRKVFQRLGLDLVRAWKGFISMGTNDQEEQECRNRGKGRPWPMRLTSRSPEGLWTRTHNGVK